jgi:MFS family permease
MLIATLPMYVIDVLKGSEKEIGLVVTVFLIASVLCRPFTRKWIDELGRKKILFISVLLFLAATVMYFGAQSLFLLLALRFLHGVGFGMSTTATGTIVADIVPPHRRGEGLGYYGMFMSMAMVIGPFWGLAVVSHYNFTVVFFLCSLFSLLSFICAAVVKISLNTTSTKME